MHRSVAKKKPKTTGQGRYRPRCIPSIVNRAGEILWDLFCGKEKQNQKQYIGRVDRTPGECDDDDDGGGGGDAKSTAGSDVVCVCGSCSAMWRLLLRGLHQHDPSQSRRSEAALYRLPPCSMYNLDHRLVRPFGLGHTHHLPVSYSSATPLS